MYKKLVKIDGNDYIINFPNVGQMIEIEQLKLAYTNGRYIEFAMSNLVNHIFILDFVDAVSYLSILIPELKKDLGIEEYTKMDSEKTKEIIRAYKEEFIPWFKPILEDLYDFNKKAEKVQKDDLEDGTSTDQQT